MAAARRASTWIGGISRTTCCTSMRAPLPSTESTGAAAIAPERLILIATELFAPGGIQRVGRQVIDALDGCAPLAVGSLRDAAIPREFHMPAGSDVRLAAGSRVKLGAWALGQARRRCAGTQVLLMHVHLAPLALPLITRGAHAVVFLYGV